MALTLTIEMIIKQAIGQGALKNLPEGQRRDVLFVGHTVN